jgi:hypothetical protein
MVDMRMCEDRKIKFMRVENETIKILGFLLVVPLVHSAID